MKVAALAAIRAREQAATPGPWRANNGSREVASGNGWFMPLHYVPEAVRPDMEFIAHARDDVPRMADALDAVLALCDRYEHADERFNPPTGQQVAAKVHNAITEALTRKEEA